MQDTINPEGYNEKVYKFTAPNIGYLNNDKNMDYRNFSQQDHTLLQEDDEQ